MTSWNIYFYAIDQSRETCTDFDTLYEYTSCIWPSFVYHSGLAICDCLRFTKVLLAPTHQKNSFVWMTLIPVLCHFSTKISGFVLLICSKLDLHKTLSLEILAIIATRYCHYGDVSLAARCLGSKIGRTAGRLALMLCSRSLLRTVLELIGLNPGMLLAVRFDIWNHFRRCTSLMGLSWRRDVTRGRPERLWFLVLPDCLNRLHNDSIVLRWQPQCIAKTLWAPLNC
jgi:hypothetical protein